MSIAGKSRIYPRPELTPRGAAVLEKYLRETIVILNELSAIDLACARASVCYKKGTMQIQVNTDKNIEGREKLVAHVEKVVTRALSRFSSRITRVEVHLSDENGHKGGGDDKRCAMEARVEGRPPTVVTHHGSNVDQALDGAADKLKRALEKELDKLDDHHRIS